MIVVGAQLDGDALAEQFGTSLGERGVERLEKRLKNTARKQAGRKAGCGELDELMMLSMFNQETLVKHLKADLHVYFRAHEVEEGGKKQDLIMAEEDHMAVLSFLSARRDAAKLLLRGLLSDVVEMVRSAKQ